MDSNKKYQTLISSDDFQQTLESLGYNLIDCGDHWRTQALYRNGDNKTAVKIYKNTGVWMDFVQNKGSQPFESLVRATASLRNEDYSSIISKIKSGTVEQYVKKQTIEMEKVYPAKSLEKLFPNYKFYNDRKISEATQQLFDVGLAGVGKMYRRMVFPIYNEHKQIIGFSGRKVDNDNNYPKWKHIGRRNNWVYPAFNVKTGVNEAIEQNKTVILVESIGDALALYEQNIKNVLVIFGLCVNNNIINFLSSKCVNNIYICTNNDNDSSQNRGHIAAVKNYLKLSKYFDLQNLSIKMPPKPYNDFGDANLDDFELKNWYYDSVDQPKQFQKILQFIDKNNSCFTKKEIKTSLVLSNEHS